MRDFLATDSIYATEKYRQGLETRARANVEAEVALLSAGTIPAC